MGKSEDLLETAWAIIANANTADWNTLDTEWVRAAVAWRDRYFRYKQDRNTPKPVGPISSVN